MIHSAVVIQCTRVTDGRTDRRTDRQTDGIGVAYTRYSIYVGTVENHGKKMVKTRQTFVKIAKITAKTRHQTTGPKTIIQSIKVNI